MLSVRSIACLLAVLLPQRLKRLLYRRGLGWTVADDAHVGFSYIEAEVVSLGPGARIGHGNIVRNLRVFELGSRAYVKHFNDVFGADLGTGGERTFRLGDDGQVMSRHFFDVCGSVLIGSGTLFAGRGTQVYTHSIVPGDGRDVWRVGEVVIGDGAKVFAGAIVIHCRLPPGATLAAGAVLTKSYDAQPGQRLFIAGNPAVVVDR